uniref:Uncharacterized protein n=1 Tax=Avena sativa TaxID=4498 RepID=A0ACD5UEY3_AVESA
MPRKVVSGPDYDDDEYGDYEDYEDYYDDDDDYEETAHVDVKPPVKEKEPLKKSSNAVPVLWKCSICTFGNHETMVYCEMCGVFRESLVKSAKDGPIKVDSANGISNNYGTSALSNSDSTKMPVKTRATNFDGDSERKHGSTTHDKVNSAQLASVGSSPGTGKKKQPIILPDEDVPVERTTRLIPDHFQLKEDQSSRASSSAQNKDYMKTPSSDISQLSTERNNVSVAQPYLPEEYKPEEWMLADQESGMLSQLNLAIVGHVDSGKSTLSGRLLHLLGKISKRDMHKNEKEAKEKGKGSFAYAWAMDESTEERERGVTMTVAVAYLETKKHRVVEFHIHHVKEAARITKIVALLDKTGKPSKTAPRFLKSKQSAVVQVALDGAICVEEFSKCRALGRAFLRSSGSTVAVGIVNKIMGQDHY